MYFLWRYNLQRISLLRQLKLVRSRKKEKHPFRERFKEGVIKWSIKLAPIGQRFKFFINGEDVERKIALAGKPYGLDLAAFYGLRYLCVLAGLGLGTLLSWLGFGSFFLILFLGVGLFGPSWWIRSAAADRQERIGLDLPDFMDAMSVTLQAGAPLDPAMKQIIRGMDGPLSDELNRYMQELDMGVPRDEAYTRLMKRNQCKELETLVLSLIQGSKLGVPIANTFKSLAEDIRETRIAKIKEKAAKAGPKVTLITTFFILPGVILCILGLLILNFIYNPEGMGISGDLFG